VVLSRIRPTGRGISAFQFSVFSIYRESSLPAEEGEVGGARRPSPTWRKW